MKYVYHYHAQVQQSPSTITHMDGIIDCDQKIDSFEKYMALKGQIGANESVDHRNMTVCSLSFLHKKDSA